MTTPLSDNTLDYQIFGAGVRAFTTRRTIGRDPEWLCRTLHIDERHLVIPHQTHQDTVRIIDETFTDLPLQVRKERLEGVDAVMTNLADTCIGVSTADCIPVLLYDPEHAAAAAVHAGWRGTVRRIVQKTIAAMAHTYGTRPEALLAAIGPGISIDNFEVGDEVYEAFLGEGFDMNRIAARYPDRHATGSTKWHLDIVECNRLQLTAAGVPAESIDVANICTYDNNHLFFSARREQKGDTKCGRNFNAIIIRPQP